MPIQPTDLGVWLSQPEAESGDAAASVSVQSLGGYLSTSRLLNRPLNNLFPDLTGLQNQARTVQYRCVFIRNTHPALTLIDTRVWLARTHAAATDVSVGLDPTGVVVADTRSRQAVTVPNEFTAPAGVQFMYPTGRDIGLLVGDLPAGGAQAVWLRRAALNSEAFDSDGFTIVIEGDTQAGVG